MKTIAIALATALVSAAASVGSVGELVQSNERELKVEMPIDAIAAQQLVPYIEMAARGEGLTRIRAYKTDVFIPLEQAQLSFVKDGTSFVMHVAVESEYRFKKGERQQVLNDLKQHGQKIFTEALLLQGAASH